MINIHRRFVAAPTRSVWGNLTTIGSEDDQTYPANWGKVRAPEGW